MVDYNIVYESIYIVNMPPNSFDEIIDPIWNRCIQSRLSFSFCMVLGMTLSISCFSVIPSILKLPRNKAAVTVCIFSGCVFLFMCLYACCKFLQLKFIYMNEPVNPEESGVSLSDSFCIEVEPTTCTGGLEESNASTEILDLSCTPVTSSQQSTMHSHSTLEKICSYVSSHENNEFSASQDDAELIQVLSSVPDRMIQNVLGNKELIKVIRETSPNLFREILNNGRCSVSELEFSNPSKGEVPCNSRKENSVTTEKVVVSRSGIFSSVMLARAETSNRSRTIFTIEKETSDRTGILSFAETEPSGRRDTNYSAEMEPFEGSDTYFSAEMEPFEESDTYFSGEMEPFERSDTYFSAEMEPFGRSGTLLCLNGA
ncbi:hypothetical protein TNIN_280751 [Trichonephila inaurata madagascariensis]|uniref:Uncharacterized protein n=1 Tax=Trichonephila inaurata madagascariensis TaxID=2747483 RepID=A0A8X6Y686_9ARAC|nr:hypothetical protein TNIN_280751 [Trichonephila inaurata madagascariensis]